jgi:LytS/YehU family sensor histidine kinase
MLIIVVHNTGHWIEKDIKGTGIQNIKDRLHNAYGKTCSFEISYDETQVSIELKIPYNE